MSDPPTGLKSEKQGQPVPEICFAFVRALGTDVALLERQLVRSLRAAGFGEDRIKLSDLLVSLDVEGYLKSSPVHERYRTHMDIGDNFRSFTRRNDAVALLGVRDMAEKRQAREGKVRRSQRGWTYRILSLMHPDEVKALRQIFGPQIFVISAASPLDARLDKMARDISRSTGMDVEECRPIAMDLLNRDAGIATEGGMLEAHPSVKRDPHYPASPESFVDVGSTFQTGDVFVSPNKREESERTIERLVDLIFDHPFHTPTVDEMAMYSAYGFALRSAALSRRVGAVITTKDGDVIAGGSNDVPRFGGGLYWAEQSPDARDFQMGFDSNDVARREILMDLLNRLSSSEWLEARLGKLNPEELLKEALEVEALRSARLLDVIEYGRAVHAEMAALSDAARRGASVQGCTLYCTTFPCHECARHIVASGIDRVVYIEAYAKSRVAELYADSIGLAARATDVGKRVSFEPFVGIGPRRFTDLFSWVPRKKVDVGDVEDPLAGEVVEWDIAEAEPRETIVNRLEEYYETQVAAIRGAQERADELLEGLINDYRSSRSN